MFKRVIKYSDKHFSLFKDIKNITDLRAKPQISCSDIAASIMSILFSNIGSLNKFNQSRDFSNAKNMALKVPSASTVARVADTIDLDYVREILKSIYLKAKRSRMIEPFNGRYIGVVDGHEICSSDLHKCNCCSVRNVSKTEGTVKLNYYHKYTAFILAGQKFAFLLDIEPVYPLEGELTSSHRLLERVCINYPKAFEAVAADAYYLNGATFKLLQSHRKYTIAVLKDERRELYGQAMSLSAITAPVVYEDEAVTYRAWDHTISELWDSYNKPVRVIKSEETKYARHHSDELGKWQIKQEKADWMWVTNLPSVVGLKNIISACHSRWQIENKCFNEIANTWNADHIYRHSQNAISAFMLFLFIALNIFNIFFARNIKDKRIRSKTLLIDLIKAEYLLAGWITPIPV
jgi:hypothetical protein